MIASGAAFARKFKQDDPAMDLIDKKLLKKRHGLFTLGGWCSGKPKCTEVGNMYKLKPGPGAQRLQKLIAGITLKAKSGQDQCK